MTEKLKQTIKDEVDKLPKEIQEAVNAFDWARIVEEIGEKYRLLESEVNDLQVETLLILVGLELEDAYESNIEDEIGTTKEDAVKIADEVFQKIFIPIKKIMDENIKKNLSIKKPAPEQTLNFILSGGDYSTLIEPTSERTRISPPAADSTTPTLEEIKKKLTIRQ